MENTAWPRKKWAHEKTTHTKKKKKAEVQTWLSGHSHFSFLKPLPYSFTHSWFQLHKCSVTVEEFTAGRRARWTVTPETPALAAAVCTLIAVTLFAQHRLINASIHNPLINPPSPPHSSTHIFLWVALRLIWLMKAWDHSLSFYWGSTREMQMWPEPKQMLFILFAVIRDVDNECAKYMMFLIKYCFFFLSCTVKTISDLAEDCWVGASLLNIHKNLTRNEACLHF